MPFFPLCMRVCWPSDAQARILKRRPTTENKMPRQKEEERKKRTRKEEARRQSSLKDASRLGWAPFPGVLYLSFSFVFFLSNTALHGDLVCGVLWLLFRTRTLFLFCLCVCVRRGTQTHEKRATTKEQSKRTDKSCPCTRARRAHTKNKSWQKKERDPCQTHARLEAHRPAARPPTFKMCAKEIANCEKVMHCPPHVERNEPCDRPPSEPTIAQWTLEPGSPEASQIIESKPVGRPPQLTRQERDAARASWKAKMVIFESA